VSTDTDEKQKEVEAPVASDTDSTDAVSSNNVSVEIEEIGPCKKTLNVTVSQEGVQEKFDTSYQELVSNINVPGFRKGRSPRKVIEKRFGSKVSEEVQKTLLDESLQTALQDHDLQLLGDPSFDEISFEPGQEMTYKATVEVRPKIELPEYKGLPSEPIKIEIPEDEVTGEIDRLRSMQGTFVISDKPAGKEDRLACHLEILDDGKVVWEKKNISVFPPNGHIYGIPVPELGKLLEGVTPETQKETEVEIPEQFEEESLCGKKLTLKLSVQEVRMLKLPELDDNFAQALGMESVEAFKEIIHKGMASQKEVEARRVAANKLMDEILEKTDFELPQDMTEQLVQERQQREAMRMQYGGVPEEEVTSRVEQMLSESTEAVKKELRASFILNEIASKEEIEVSPEEVSMRIRMMAMNAQKTPAQVERQLAKENAFSQLVFEMREEKVRNFILENASTGEEQDASDSEQTEEVQPPEAEESKDEATKTTE